MDALDRSVRVSDELGVVGVVVDAKHEKAKTFYVRYDFKELSTSSLILILTIDQIRKSIS